MDSYRTPYKISALAALNKAQEIAFSPFAFQTVITLIRTGILDHLSNCSKTGASIEEIEQHTGISSYGIKVLLDMALTMKVVWLDNENYIIDKIGHFLLDDKMSKVNLNFTQDVCYQGLFHLEQSIREGKPIGLSVFGDWPTIYPALTSLPDKAKNSWFEFDHYYSDNAFPDALNIVFEQPVSNLLELGGNTGKWAKQCTVYNEQVEVTVIDLPEQITALEQNLAEFEHSNRVHGLVANVLHDDFTLNGQFNKHHISVGHYEVIWMSQFLDCFSEEQIAKILKALVNIMDNDTYLFIMETFWDRQKYDAAAYSLNATSLYFTAMANGNSRMYHSKDMIKLIQQSGMYIESDHDDLGLGHTLFKCRKRP